MLFCTFFNVSFKKRADSYFQCCACAFSNLQKHPKLVRNWESVIKNYPILKILALLLKFRGFFLLQYIFFQFQKRTEGPFVSMLRSLGVLFYEIAHKLSKN